MGTNTARAGADKLWGKFRGRVVKNEDPLFLGRLCITVPAVSEGVLGWALPCLPYDGPDFRAYAIPPAGTQVWIEFEGGDLDYPIWSGCFWGPEDVDI